MAKVKLQTSRANRALDELQLAGLFFVIDGHIYVDATTESVKHETHQNLFQVILKEYPDLKRKYADYSYLYFPRGFVVRDEDTGRVMLGAPQEMTQTQREKVLDAYNLKDSDYTFMKDDGHYSLPYVLNRVKRSYAQGWSQDIIDEEIEFVKDFFMRQIYQI